MIWVYVFSALAVIVTVWWLLDNTWSEWDTIGVKIGSTTFVLFMSLTVGFVLAFVANLISTAFVDSKWVYVESANVKNINDTSKTSGSFFLGTGSVDSEPVFWYYADLDTYAELRQTPADMSLIVEDDGQPRVVKEQLVSTNKFWSAFPSLAEYETRYVFHIPEGSITNNFELDAKP